MSACASPNPPPVMTPATIGKATERLWAIRRAIRAGVVDPRGALAALGVLASLPHPGISRLARQTIEEVAPGLLAAVGAALPAAASNGDVA